MSPTLPTASLSVEQFQRAVAVQDFHRKLTPPRYARRKILAAAHTHCPLCHNEFDHSRRTHPRFPVIATVLHTFLGGPLTVENLFVCCRSCQQRRASTDLFTVPSLPDFLVQQRLAVLQLSVNHLVSVPRSATLGAVREALALRHAHPRSRVYAAQADDGTCLLGVSRRFGDRQSKGIAHLLGKLSGSTVLGGPLTVYQLDDHAFRRVVWELIEANALVVGVGRRTGCRDFQDYWWLTSSSVGELRARRVAGVSVPLNQVRPTVGQRAQRYRRQRERERHTCELVAAQEAFRQAEADLAAYYAARRSPHGFPVSANEGVRLLGLRLEASRRLQAAAATSLPVSRRY